MIKYKALGKRAHADHEMRGTLFLGQKGFTIIRHVSLKMLSDNFHGTAAHKKVHTLRQAHSSPVLIHVSHNGKNVIHKTALLSGATVLARSSIGSYI